MPVPPSIDADDPWLTRVRSIALAFPLAAEKLVVGIPAFYTRKVFAYFGMSYKVDGIWVHGPRALSVLLPPDERLALLGDPRVHVPGYIGPHGWIGMVLDDEPDWGEISELIEESYRFTAGPKLLAALDSGS